MRSFLILLVFALLPFVAGAGEQVHTVSVATPVHASTQTAMASHDRACCNGHSTHCSAHHCEQGCDASCFLMHCTASAQAMLPGDFVLPTLAAQPIKQFLTVTFRSISTVPVTPPPRV